MEREYIIAFVIVLVVVFILGFMAVKYYPETFKEVGIIAKDVFDFGKEEKKIEQTQGNIQNLIDSLAKCQKYSAENCFCQIEKKNKLPVGYKIHLQLLSKEGQPSMQLYSFSDEDKLVPVQTKNEALKLEGLKLGMAYWGHCKNCEPSKIDKQTVDDASPDIFCVFSSESTGKSSSIVLMGDSAGDWTFPFHTTQGVPFDQLSSEPKYKNIGNIYKLDNKRYCFITSNLLRYNDDNYNPPEFTKKDDVVKLYHGFAPTAEYTSYAIMTNTLATMQKNMQTCSGPEQIKAIDKEMSETEKAIKDLEKK
ncbi:MAG: hypothetical protein U9Q69_06360 [Nanoarchaeota archaeon]|nr:hypothetical protein [Nanoarchaeota archaeon]